MVSITGKKDAKFLKKRYQRKLDKQHQAIEDKRKRFYKMNHKLKKNLSHARSAATNIKASEEEREDLYRELLDLLREETDFEKEMMDLSKEGTEKESIKLTQKFKDTDIEDVSYDSMKR